jgi:hypothetical protein
MDGPADTRFSSGLLTRRRENIDYILDKQKELRFNVPRNGGRIPE